MPTALPTVTVHVRDLANLAGLLTASRLPLALVFSLVVHDPFWALGVYGVAMLTDVLDGPLARWTGQTSQSGALLDGFVDKVFQVNAAWSLVLADAIPSWWLLCWFSREILELMMVPWLWKTFFHGRARLHRSTGSGKALTIAIAVSCGLVLTRNLLPGGLTVVSALTPALGVWGAASGMAYALRSWRLQHARTRSSTPRAASPAFEAAADLR